MSSSLSSFLLGPNNPQQVTSSSSTSSTLPNWLTQYSQGLLGSASGLIPQTTSNLGTAQSPVSAANPYLGQASSLVSGATNPATQGLAAANPYLSSATSTLGSALSGPNGVSLAQPSVNQATGIVNSAINPANSGTAAASPYMGEANQTFSNPSTVSSYMSPYLNDVTAYNTDLANQNLEQQVLPAVESQSIANGQFGSSPMGTAMGQQIDLTQQNLQAQNLAAANTGYEEAGQLFDTDAARQAGLASTAGTLATQQQGAQLQGASTLGSLGTTLGSLGNTAQSNQLTGANLEGTLGSTAGQLANTGASLGLSGASTLGSLGNAAGTLTGTGNSEQLSQLGLLGSLTGTPGGSTTTQNNSYPNPYSLAQVAGSGSSSLANLLTGLTGSSSGGILGQTSSLASLLGGTGGTTAANTNLNNIIDSYSSTPDLGSSLTTAPAPDFSTATMGLPSYFSLYHSGGRVGRQQDGPMPAVADHWYAVGGHVRPRRPFMAADGGAVELPTYAQDMSLASSPNAIFDPNEANSYSYASPQTASGLPSMTAMPAVGSGASTTPTSSLAGALGTALGASAASTGIGAQPGSVTPGQVIGGLSAANSLANTASSLAGAGSATPAALGSVLGGLGGALGIANAIEHPSPQSGVSGAYDAYKLYNSGSSLLGGGAGSTAGTALTAADLAEPAPDLASIATPDVSSLLSGTADVGTDTAAAGAGTGAGAGSGALGAVSSLGSVAVPLANAAILGEVINGIVQGNQRGPPLTFSGAGVTQNPDGKLGSGNSIATMGDIGYGEGNNEAQGSGQLYRVNPDGSAANNTVYDWLGQGATNQADQAYTDYQNSLKPAGSGGPSPFGLSTGPVNNPATDLSNANTAYSSLFNSTGGAQAWGMSEADFQNQMIQLAGDAQANGGNGLLLGVAS